MDSRSSITLSHSDCSYVIGTLHIPPGGNSSAREWRYFAIRPIADLELEIVEVSKKKIEAVYRHGSYEEPSPWGMGSGGPRTRKVEGWVGPLFPTGVTLTLTCHEHDIVSEFEVTYLEWGPRKDVPGYDGYTEKDTAIAIQVADFKSCQDNPREKRDFYKERFEPKVAEEEIREESDGDLIGKGDDVEARKVEIILGEEAAENPRPLRGEKKRGAVDQELASPRHKNEGDIKRGNKTDAEAKFERELESELGPVEDNRQGWTLRRSVWYPPRAFSHPKLRCCYQHDRPGWMFFMCRDKNDVLQPHTACYRCHKKERTKFNIIYGTSEPPPEISGAQD